MNIFARITRSLSARLLAIFMLAAVAYVFGARYVVQVFLDTDYLREDRGAHFALYADYVLQDGQLLVKLAHRPLEVGEGRRQVVLVRRTMIDRQRHEPPRAGVKQSLPA